RELALGLLAQEQRAAAQVHAAPLGEAFRDGIAERAAVRLVDERDEIADSLADRDAARRADQLLGGLIHVIDRAGAIRRDNTLADRLERNARLQLVAAERGLDALALSDVAGDRDEGRLAAQLDAPAVQLGPETAVVAVDELNLDRRRSTGRGNRAEMLAH